ncbi:ATP-binding protein [Acidobacteriota bacterium]
MAFKLNWQRRSVVLLAGFTLVLGFILTTLAVREAEREKLTRESELDGEQQRYVTLLIGEIDSLFSGIEEKITAALPDPQTQLDMSMLSEAFRREAVTENLIKDIFLVGSNGELILPLKDPLFLTSERRRLAKINLGQIENIGLFNAGESAELTTQNLPLAIRSYKALFNSLSNDSSRALVLNRLGRSYMKAGNIKLALDSYDTILKDYSHELSSNGVPLGIIAFIQIGNITLKSETERMGEILLEFYSRLLSTEWNLDKTQFQLYRGMIRNMSEDWRTVSKETKGNVEFKNKWDELEKRAEVKLKDLESEEDLIERIIPLVQTRLFEFNSESPEFSRFSETVDETLFLICTASIPGDKILGILVDDSVLIQERIPMILERLPIPEAWIIQIIDTAGRVLMGEEALYPDTSNLSSSNISGFEHDFPPWQVRISRRYPGAADRQYSMRRNVYILVVLVMMAVLFFGGFMVIRSTAKELELARLKSEFVSTVSHELRTPLMSIRYLSEMLDTDRVKSEEKKKVYYGKINTESERLSRLIENMLDFSKIEAGMKKYRFEDLSVADLARDVADRFREYVVNKPVTLECEIPDRLPQMPGDKEAVSRALFNLLDNAVKYSGKDPKVYFRAHVEGDFVLLEVQDKGFGISEDEQKKVFEKFYRSPDPTSKNIEGSGIGLTLVNHIIKAHGGEVLLESILGEGTRVILKLPIFQKGKEDEKDTDR